MSRGAKEGTFPYYLEAAALEAATHSNRHEYKLKDKETHAHCTDTLFQLKNGKKTDAWTQSADTDRCTYRRHRYTVNDLQNYKH